MSQTLHFLRRGCRRFGANEFSNTGLLPATLDWVNRAIANQGGGSISNTTTLAVDGFLTGLASSGLEQDIIADCIFAPDSLNAATTPLHKGPGLGLWSAGTGFSSSDISINGLIGNSTGKYLDPGIIDSTAFSSVNNCGITVYNFSVVANTGYNGGVLTSDFVSGLLIRGGGTADTFLSYDAGIPHTGIGAGFYSGSRTASNAEAFYAANSGTAFAALSSTTNATNHSFTGTKIFFFVMGQGNSPFTGFYSGVRMSYCALHNGLTSARTQTFYNLIQGLRVALGGGFV